MSDHNLAEALRLAREWFNHEEAGVGPQAFEVIAAADAALAAHEAEQQAGGELARERSARQAAQIELERYKALLARSRIDLMRELREQGWRNPGEQQAGEAAAYALLFPGDPRLCLSTVFDTYTEAINYAVTRVSGPAEIVPLFTHPQQPLTEEQIRLERKRIDPMAEDMDAWSFGQGVRFAERALGITKDTK